MFTGLITDIGTILARTQKGATWTVKIKTSYDTSDLLLGESIAVDGACLTVTSIGPDFFTVDASPETISKTTLGDRTPGARVHLERALRIGDRLGGHLVLGHVDGTGSIESIRRDANAWIFDVRASSEVAPYLIEKGSITLDGVSLTINRFEGDRFSLAIIPHTAEETNLASYRPGQKVNLEADVLGKYVRKFVAPDTPGLSLESLAQAGFTYS